MALLYVKKLWGQDRSIGERWKHQASAQLNTVDKHRPLASGIATLSANADALWTMCILAKSDVEPMMHRCIPSKQICLLSGSSSRQANRYFSFLIIIHRNWNLKSKQLWKTFLTSTGILFLLPGLEDMHTMILYQQLNLTVSVWLLIWIIVRIAEFLNKANYVPLCLFTSYIFSGAVPS